MLTGCVPLDVKPTGVSREAVVKVWTGVAVPVDGNGVSAALDLDDNGVSAALEETGWLDAGVEVEAWLPSRDYQVAIACLTDEYALSLAKSLPLP